MPDHITSRAQRLIDEFEEGEDVAHGIAKVLRHLAGDWSGTYCLHPGGLSVVPAQMLENLAAELTAPTLLDRAMDGDKAAARQFLQELVIAAARQFLQELGMIDEHGQLKHPYRPEDLNDDHR